MCSCGDKTSLLQYTTRRLESSLRSMSESTNATMVPHGAYEFLDTKETRAHLIEQYDNFLFDCDGVLWSGPTVLPGVVSFFHKLRERGKRILFVSNNASKSRRTLLERINAMGIDGREDEVFSSAYATAAYLKDVLRLPTDRKAYVVGMNGLEDELDANGIQHIGGTDEQDCQGLDGLDFSPLASKDALDPSVAAVVCGIDTKFSYRKLAKAFRYITRPGAEGEVRAGEQNGGCHFVCTNEDVTFPSSEGLFPGAGAVWKGIQVSSGRDPIVVGKPHQPMIDTIFARFAFDKSRTLMVGDRLDTDIAFGQRGGIDTLLVLTGISTLEHVHASDAAAVPTYVVNGLCDLNTALS